MGLGPSNTLYEPEYSPISSVHPSEDEPCEISKLYEPHEISKSWHCDSATLQNVAYWASCHLHSDKKCDCRLLSYFENSEAKFILYQNGFFSTVLLGIDYHRHIVLDPNDIWLAICMHFSYYVNNNAEALRKIFVKHEGQIHIVVDQTCSKWDEFFATIMPHINSNNNICEILLEANFSTTGPVEKLVSYAVIMDTFKKYFTYNTVYPKEEPTVAHTNSFKKDCSSFHEIPGFRFMGKLIDWTSLIDKLKKLEFYTLEELNDPFKLYIKNLVPILEKFVDALSNKIDSGFWKDVLVMKPAPAFRVDVSGWIVKFFGNDTSIDLYDIPNNRFTFPITVNYITETVISGFGRITLNGDALQPQQFMTIYHDSHGK